VPDRKLLAKAYDRSAETYDERFRALQEVKYRAALPFLPRLPPGALCLDAGGGTGLFPLFLQEQNHPLARQRWLIFDLSVGMLRKACTRASLVAAVDLARPPLRPNSCSLVVAFTSLLEEVELTVSEMQALLVPGGTFVASFLAPEAKTGLAPCGGLRLIAGPMPAGQDLLFAFRKD
jgi:ubiquinone/menaquinone biosynthesis C-methylase UbiE